MLINEALLKYKNAELVAVVERDRALRAFIQYDVEVKNIEGSPWKEKMKKWNSNKSNLSLLKKRCNVEPTQKLSSQIIDRDDTWKCSQEKKLTKEIFI